MVVRILADRDGLAKGRNRGGKAKHKKERRSRSPASLCDVEPHARSGRSSRRRETFRSLDHAPISMVAHEEAARSRPRPVILRRVAATRSQSWPDWNRDSAVELAAQRAPSTPPNGIAAKPTGRGTLRSLTPPPSATRGNGRPWACLARMRFRLISGAFGVLLRHPLDRSSGTFG